MENGQATENKVNIYYAGFKHRIGGAFFHAVNLSKGLNEQGYNVRIITLDDLPVYWRYIPHLLQKIVNQINSPMGYLAKQKSIRFFYKWLFRNSADIEIFEDVYTYWPSKSPSLVMLHALWSDNLQSSYVSSEQRERLEKKEAAIINTIETTVNTVSYPYKDFLKSRLMPLGLKKSIEVIELGVDIEKFSNGGRHNQSIIFVGSLEERKNIKFLLNVFEVLQSHSAYRLTIVGDGPQNMELRDIVASKNIEGVTFLGRLSYDEVINELPKHQYYMHTSTKESFSYSLLEAKLSGLTTIAYAHLEVPKEFIDITVDNFEINEWVDKITLHNPEVDPIDVRRFSYQNMTLNTLDKVSR